MLFLGLGAVDVVTVSFTGLVGALSGPGGGGQVAVGAILLVWPRPTLLVLAVVVAASGSWSRRRQ